MNYVCIGLNYADHAAEAGMPVPKEPIIFLKSLGALCGPNDDVKLPRGSKKLDWEVELGIVIGKTARYVPENEALNHVAGYCVCNDVSEREFQLERAGTWDKGKGCDTFGPTGPWVVTKDEVPDPQNLPLWTEVNGKRMQNGTTKTMIFGVVKLVSYVSHFITLHAGDVIATGTPPGVGQGVKPEPIFLKIGDTMRLSSKGWACRRSGSWKAEPASPIEVNRLALAYPFAERSDRVTDHGAPEWRRASIPLRPILNSPRAPASLSSAAASLAPARRSSSPARASPSCCARRAISPANSPAATGAGPARWGATPARSRSPSKH